MPDINEQYEKYLNKHTARVNQQILKRYKAAINQVMLGIDKVTYNGQVFSIKDYPQLQRSIDAELKKMHASIYSTVVNGIETSWSLSNQKNDYILDRRIGKKTVDKRVRRVLYDPNKGALGKFVDRKDRGLGLSDRVWNTLKPFKTELEAGLGLGVSEGKSAAVMAKEAQKYLLEPDKLYRRVRDAKGKLQLSTAAKADHPGQGVYRSSFKNANRLTRTENNMAYRTADQERWKNQPFVLGYEVRLSNSHPRYDICDNLKGKYPKDFVFKGWHPQCLCHTVPIMMAEDDYDKLENAILGIEDFDPNPADQISSPPPGFSKFVRENKKRIEGWQNEPYWVSDNREYYDKAASSRKPRPEIVPAGRSIADQFTNKDRAIRKTAETALTEIDKVHGDGTLEDIPIKKFSSVTIQGMFEFTRKGDPLQIKLSTKSADALTMVHETGHYLDLFAIGTPGKFDTVTKGSPTAAVIAKARQSDNIKALQKILDNDAIEFQGKTINASPSLRKHVEYLLDPKEIWARAYSQFIAKRSQSGQLLAGVEKRIARYESTGILTQWKDADFADLEQAIEDMMIEIGWMVSR